jgi:hypothetical protein
MLRGEGISDDGTPMFADVAMASGADNIRDARGMGVADFDRDGDLDIVINVNPGDCGKPSVAPVLLRNDIGQNRNWLAVDLAGVDSNRDAVGAHVTVKVVDQSGQETRLLRHVTAGGGYASQNSDRLYFGLGEHELVDTLIVQWPSGQRHEFSGVRANRLVNISEDGSIKEGPLREPGLRAEHKIVSAN